MREDSNFVKLKSLNKTNEVYHHSSYLCSFGNSYGFRVHDNNTSTNESCLGNNGYYEIPAGI